MNNLDIKNKITIPRGNTREISVEIAINDEPYFPQGTDVIIFTVKNYIGGDLVLQKEITPEHKLIDERGNPIILISSHDTLFLEGKNFIYDVAVIYNGEFYTAVMPSPFVIADVVTEGNPNEKI